MGMYTGQFKVVDNSNVAPAPAAKNTGSCGGGSGGCGCGGGKVKAANAGAQVSPAPAKDQNGVQLLKTVYTYDNDISPNEFSVKAGKPVRMEIDVRDQGSGCMGSIYIPQLTTSPEFLDRGKTVVFEFTPEKPGNYPITCAMGVPRGSITVN